jgi:hypothetical protein
VVTEALNAVITGSVHDLIRGSLMVSLGLFGLSLLARPFWPDLKLVSFQRAAIWGIAIQAYLLNAPGIASYAEAASFPVELVAIEALQRRIATYEQAQGAALTADQRRSLTGCFGAVATRNLGSDLPDLEFAPGMGRNLKPADAGQPVVLLPGSQAMQLLGLRPGKTLTLRLENGAEVSLEIVVVSGHTASTWNMASKSPRCPMPMWLHVPRSRSHFPNPAATCRRSRAFASARITTQSFQRPAILGKTSSIDSTVTTRCSSAVQARIC